MSSVRSAKDYLTVNEMKWVWHALVSEKEVSPRARMYFRRYRKKELVVLLVDVRSGLLNRNLVAVSRPAVKMFKS